MQKVVQFLLLLLCFFSASGQNKTSIEFSLIGRYDRHAHSISNFAGRAYNDTNQLYGKSYGVNLAFRQKIARHISAFFGVGYYRLGIDKIKGSMPFGAPGIRTARNIDYDDGSTNLLYSTSKYHYNNLSVTVGFSRTVPLKERLSLDLGVEGLGYHTFSQRYRLFNGPNSYSTTNSKPLEFGANATIGILKEHKTYFFRPALLVPIYQNLKGDNVFFEDRNQNLSKWLNGIGLTLRIGKYL